MAAAQGLESPGILGALADWARTREVGRGMSEVGRRRQGTCFKRRRWRVGRRDARNGGTRGREWDAGGRTCAVSLPVDTVAEEGATATQRKGRCSTQEVGHS